MSLQTITDVRPGATVIFTVSETITSTVTVEWDGISISPVTIIDANTASFVQPLDGFELDILTSLKITVDGANLPATPIRISPEDGYDVITLVNRYEDLSVDSPLRKPGLEDLTVGDQIVYKNTATLADGSTEVPININSSTGLITVATHEAISVPYYILDKSEGFDRGTSTNINLNGAEAPVEQVLTEVIPTGNFYGFRDTTPQDITIPAGSVQLGDLMILVVNGLNTGNDISSAGWTVEYNTESPETSYKVTSAVLTKPAQQADVDGTTYTIVNSSTSGGGAIYSLLKATGYEVTNPFVIDYSDAQRVSDFQNLTPDPAGINNPYENSLIFTVTATRANADGLTLQTPSAGYRTVVAQGGDTGFSSSVYIQEKANVGAGSENPSAITFTGIDQSSLLRALTFTLGLVEAGQGSASLTIDAATSEVRDGGVGVDFSISGITNVNQVRWTNSSGTTDWIAISTTNTSGTAPPPDLTSGGDYNGPDFGEIFLQVGNGTQVVQSSVSIPYTAPANYISDLIDPSTPGGIHSVVTAGVDEPYYLSDGRPGGVIPDGSVILWPSSPNRYVFSNLKVATSEPFVAYVKVVGSNVWEEVTYNIITTPVLTTPPSISVGAGEQFELEFEVEKGHYDTYSVDPVATLTVDDNGYGRLVVSGYLTESGNVTLVVTNNSTSEDDTAVVPVTIDGTVSPPSVTGISNLTSQENTSFSFDVNVTDADSVSVVSGSNVTSLNITNTVGTTWQVTGETPDHETQENTTVTVIATNADGSVNHPVQLQSIDVPEPTVDETNITVADGQAVELNYTSGGDFDAYAFSLPGFTVVDNGDGTLTVTGTAQYSNGSLQTATLTLTEDSQDYTVSTVINVQATIPDPTISGATAVTLVENSTESRNYTVTDASGVSISNTSGISLTGSGNNWTLSFGEFDYEQETGGSTTITVTGTNGSTVDHTVTYTVVDETEAIGFDLSVFNPVSYVESHPTNPNVIRSDESFELGIFGIGSADCLYSTTVNTDANGDLDITTLTVTTVLTGMSEDTDYRVCLFSDDGVADLLINSQKVS